MRWIPEAVALAVLLVVATGSDGAITLAQSGMAQQQDDEKKRVPKEEDKEKSEKPPPPPPPADDEDGGGFWGACLGSCVADFFSNLFGADEEVAATPIVGTVVVPGVGTGSGVEIGHGYIQNLDSLQTLVQLWDGPGGAERGFVAVAFLPPGSEVGVLEARSFDAGDWVQVQTTSGVLVRGWVQAEHVDWATYPPAPETGANPPDGTLASSTWTPLGTQTVAFMTDISWFYLAGPREVREEYEDGGLRFGLGAVITPASSFQMTLGFGYGEAPGEPLYDYETATTIDSPYDSRLQIFDASLRFGQYTAPHGGRTRLYWGLGPALYWVKESADIEIFSASTGLPLGERQEEHSWVRFGADLALGLSYEVTSRLHFGALVRGIWVSWDAEAQESLTLDFIGDKSLAGFGIGLSLAYDAF